MQVRRVALGTPVAPFGDVPSDLPVLGQTLRGHQDRTLRACGLEPSDTPVGRHLVLGDHTWITGALLERFLDACPESGGRLAIGGAFLRFTAPLQGLGQGDPVAVPVAIAPDPEALVGDLPLVPVDLDATVRKLDLEHPAFRGIEGEGVPVTDRMVHTVTHWSHVMRVNLLALVAHAEGERRRFEAAPWTTRLVWALRVLSRMRSPTRWGLAAALTERGPGCVIHPTATVEACVLGSGVEVGPHAVVRGSWLGDRVKVQEHARVNLTIAGEGATLGRGLMCNLCTLLPGAFVSQGFGVQASLFGRDAFVAMGTTLYDLSFGREIDVVHQGERVSSGTRFLGACIGHRARLGPHVRVGYGEAVPNDAFLVGDPGAIFRRIPPDLEPGVPHAMQGGALVRVGRSAARDGGDPGG